MDLLEYRTSVENNRHPWELARFAVMLRLLNDYLSSPPHHIADIGCGDTFVVNSLANNYPESKFIAVDSAFTDADIHNFKSINKHTDIKLLRSISEISLQKESLDLVLLMDVIEHIEEDKEFVKEIVNQHWISNSTLFLVTVPAYQSLYSAHDKHLLHHRRYNKTNLENTLRNADLEVLDSGYFFSTLVAVRVLQKGMELLFGAKKQEGLANKNYSSSKLDLIKNTLLLDFSLTHAIHQLNIDIPGLSSYAICRKSVQ